MYETTFPELEKSENDPAAHNVQFVDPDEEE